MKGKCRMCSQPLTRPGRLCRECERELGLGGEGDAAAGTLETLVADDAARLVDGRQPARRLRPRHVVLLAFCVGVLGAAGLRLVFGDEAPTHGRSVMLDWPLHASAAPESAERARVTSR